MTSLQGKFLALNEVRVENNRRSQVIDVYINDDALKHLEEMDFVFLQLQVQPHIINH